VARELILHFARFFSSRYRIVVYLNSKSDLEKYKRTKIDFKVLKTKNRFLFDHFSAPKKALEDKIDLLVSLKYNFPFFYYFKKKRPKVATIYYDLCYFVYPFFYPLLESFYQRRQIYSSVKRADLLLAVSQSTRNDLLRFAGADKNKIKIFYLAANPIFEKQVKKSDIIRVRKKYKLPQRFFVFLGGIQPRKNLKNIILALSQLKKKDIFLLVIGQKSHKHKEVFKNLPEGFEKLVRFTGFVSEKDLPPILKNGLGLCYCSLYEGFGLPILEAMRSGLPVIASEVTSMPEVAGGAALLVNPKNPEEIAAAMKKLLKKEERKRLRLLGYARAKKFSWSRTAKKFEEIVKELIAPKPKNSPRLRRGDE